MIMLHLASQNELYASRLRVYARGSHLLSSSTLRYFGIKNVNAIFLAVALCVCVCMTNVLWMRCVRRVKRRVCFVVFHYRGSAKKEKKMKEMNRSSSNRRQRQRTDERRIPHVFSPSSLLFNEWLWLSRWHHIQCTAPHITEHGVYVTGWSKYGCPVLWNVYLFMIWYIGFIRIHLGIVESFLFFVLYLSCGNCTVCRTGKKK